MRNSSLHTLRSVPIGYVAIIAVVAAGAGHAQAIPVTDVHVNGVSSRQVNPGGTVHVLGRWGPEGSTPDITATIDGNRAEVSEVGASYVGILIPQTQGVGKIKLKVNVRGKGEASVDIDVVKNTVAAKEGTGAAGGPDAADLVLQTFAVTKLTLVSTPGGKTIEAEGTATRLPDGFNVLVTIGPDGAPPIQPIQTPVKAGAWKVSFGPWTTDVPYGSWKAMLTFELAKQARNRAKEFKAKLPDAEKGAFERIVRQDVVIVGSEEEQAAQRNELKAHAKTLVTLTRRLFDDVDKAYVSGSRCFFRNPAGGIVDAKWEAWLKDQKLIADTPEALAAAKNDSRFARNGHFQVEPWKKWATDTLLPPLAKAKQDHEDFSKRWFTAPDATVERLESELLTMVGERLRNTGQALCDQTKVPLPPEVVELLPTVNAGQDQVSRQAFEAKCKLLLRTLGEVVPD
jgi:hypothetical protein